MKCLPSGPANARIMIVGEAPGSEEDQRGEPFIGTSGGELTKMLHDAGIPRAQCFLTNVARYRPPGNDIAKFFLDKKQTIPGPQITEGIQELKREVSIVNPHIIVALGNTPLWVFTGNKGITNWRGSVLTTTPEWGTRKVKVLPTYHPAAILRQWDWRWIAVHDLRRARSESESRDLDYPEYRFEIRPSFDAVMSRLQLLLSAASSRTIRIAVDLETRGGHIACVGIAWSRLDAICIPIMCVENPSGYWTVEQEFEIVRKLRELLVHENVEVIGQNYLYDKQYLAKEYGIDSRCYMDTMLAHHTMWPGLPKGLDFLSSMYCAFHQYWKSEGKLWDPRTTPEEQLWVYNCKDAVITFECSVAIDSSLDKLNLRKQFEFQMTVFKAVFRMMLRGVRVETSLRNQFALELMELVKQRNDQAAFLSDRNLLGPKGGYSPKKLAEYFYDELHLPEQKNRKTKKRTCDEDALKVLAAKEPLIKRLAYSIIESRSLGSSLNVVTAGIDHDKRIRCSYNISGTVTFRFSSSENAFGGGTNLQNITAGGKSEETGLELHNLRRLLIPDQGHMICDVDLDRADLQIVVWEAEDEEMKAVLRSGLDIHLVNARLLHNLPITDEHLKDPEAVKHFQKVYYAKRHMAKEFVHATNYGGKAKTVSYVAGVSVRETEQLQKKWLGAHPGIERWHKRVEHNLMTKREVRNAFGNRIFFFGRVQELLPEALAWIPQSTVALVINRALVNLDEKCRDTIDLLLQVHDSLTFQYKRHLHPHILEQIKPHLLITVPYPDPLVIPVGFAVSDKSWGDCE